MIIEKYRVTHPKGYEEFLTEAEALEKYPESVPILTQEDIIPQEPDLLKERQDALFSEWPDAFDLIDDILLNGITDVKTRRDAIKAAHPKPA